VTKNNVLTHFQGLKGTRNVQGQEMFFDVETWLNFLIIKVFFLTAGYRGLSVIAVMFDNVTYTAVRQVQQVSLNSVLEA
jgi:hypothetical protein